MGAYSKSALRIHGMDEGGVQFPVGPQKEMCRSGRTGRSRKPLYRKVSEVRILPSPPQKHMGIFKREKPAEVSSKELVRRVLELEAKLEQTNEELNGLKKHMQGALSRVGITRFNPFREIGGDQSFSIALLDDRRNGVVITSYYGREHRIYAKAIQNGVSEHELTEEEKEAVNQAIGKAK